MSNPRVEPLEHRLGTVTPGSTCVAPERSVAASVTFEFALKESQLVILGVPSCRLES